MSIITPIVTSIVQPIVRSIIAGGAAGFSPLVLFLPGDGGGFIEPKPISKMWLTTAKLTNVSSAGDPVGLVDDETANDQDLTQAILARRPTYQTTGGYPFLQYDQVSSYSDVMATVDGTTYTSVISLRANSVKGVLFTSQQNTSPAQIIYDSASASAAISPASTVSKLRVDGVDQSLSLTRAQLATALSGASVVSIEWTPTAWGGATLSFGVYAAPGFIGPERLYGRVDIDRTLTTDELSDTEAYMAALQGVTL